ncbi:hypothetical protein AMS68_006523 [Peltaster fructicola]|uniref:Uncharacterized protein n=1 Tax=Peltaster fructicola TaxID=286661 RepID=A0A6H0Y233_9PEZI|nr:hypothetical protein AMS68_006523 [Peltaster fructicola]
MDAYDKAIAQSGSDRKRTFVRHFEMTVRQGDELPTSAGVDLSAVGECEVLASHNHPPFRLVLQQGQPGCSRLSCRAVSLVLVTVPSSLLFE